MQPELDPKIDAAVAGKSASSNGDCFFYFHWRHKKKFIAYVRDMEMVYFLKQRNPSLDSVNFCADLFGTSF